MLTKYTVSSLTTHTYIKSLLCISNTRLNVNYISVKKEKRKIHHHKLFDPAIPSIWKSLLLTSQWSPLRTQTRSKTVVDV